MQPPGTDRRSPLERIAEVGQPGVLTDATGVIRAVSPAMAALAPRLEPLLGRPFREAFRLSEDGSRARFDRGDDTWVGLRVCSLPLAPPEDGLTLHLLQEESEPDGEERRFHACLVELACARELHEGPFEVAADFLTARVGRVLGCAQMSIWLFSQDRSRLECVSLYRRDLQTHERGASLVAAEYPAYFRALQESRAVAACEAHTDPRTSELTEYLASLGITSLLDSVIRVSGRMVGVCCVEHIGPPRVWRPDEVSFAANVADRVAHLLLAIQHREAELERDQLEGELRQAQRLEALGRLTGGIAHDFNNLLSIMVGHAQAGLRGSDPEARLPFERILTVGKRATELTNQLLSVGRKQILRREGLNLNELLAGWSEALRGMLPSTIELQVEASPAPLFVQADAGQLERVVTNLCVNARDAIEGSGSILVRTERGVDDVGRDQALLIVEDDGAGIPPEMLDKIFDPFFSTKPLGAGTGLGLAMVHGIITQHGGKVRVQSRVGMGSRFTVRLPAAEDEPAPARSLPPAERAAPDRSRRLLVAEDDPELRELLVEDLTDAGYEVVGVGDGLAAVERFREEPFDLVLLDVIMPHKSGTQTFEDLRAMTPGLPVVFLTGYGADNLTEALLRHEDISVLLKPYHLAGLLETVERALSRGVGG